jgi:hypothetical protein
MLEKTSNSGMRYIAFWGAIEDGDADKLSDLLDSTGIDVVVVHSPGGSATEGLSLGELMRDKDIKVVVPKRGMCLSACAIMFTGSNDQVLEGLLGFHVAWTSADLSANDAMQGGQYFGLLGAAHFIDSGYGLALPHIVTVTTSPEVFLVFTDIEELNRFRIGRNLPAGEYLKSANWVTREWVNSHLADSNRLRELLGG